MEVKRHRRCHRPSQAWAQAELVASLREGTDVLVLACLSVKRVLLSPPKEERGGKSRLER